MARSPRVSSTLSRALALPMEQTLGFIARPDEVGAAAEFCPLPHAQPENKLRASPTVEFGGRDGYGS